MKKGSNKMAFDSALLTPAPVQWNVPSQNEIVDRISPQAIVDFAGEFSLLIRNISERPLTDAQMLRVGGMMDKFVAVAAELASIKSEIDLASKI